MKRFKFRLQRLLELRIVRVLAVGAVGPENELGFFSIHTILELGGWLP